VMGRVSRSVLSPGVHVEAGAEVIESVIMSDVRVERGARVRHAVVDKYARIGSGAEIGAGDPPESREHAWLEGLTLIGKDAVVPPSARVERAAVVGVGVQSEAFAGGCVEAGSILANRPWHEGIR